MKQFIIFILLLLPAFTEAQPPKDKLDSLQLALKNAANDTIRMDVSQQLGFYYGKNNKDSSRFYLEQTAFIAKKLNLKIDEAVALQSEANLYIKSNYPKALELLLQTLKINEDPQSEKNVWNLPPRLSPHKVRLNSLGWTQHNLGQLYGNTGNTEKQISNLLQAIKLAESVQDTELYKSSNLDLGIVYFNKLKKLDSALYFEQKALGFISKSAGKNNDGSVFSAIGNIYKEKGNFDLAKDAFDKGLRLMEENNNLPGIGEICLSLSSFYKTIHKPDSSLLYANTALKTYRKFNDLAGVAEAYSSLSSAYDEQNRTDSAFAYLKLATALHDSLNNAERKNLLVYQNVSFEEQNRVKDLEDEKIKTQNKIRTNALLAGIAVIMLVAFILYRNNRHRKSANELLQKQKEEIAAQKENVEQTLVELKSTQSQLIQSEKMASLGELTAGIAHEIQNPLNFVNNFSEVSNELLDEMNAELDKGEIEEAKAMAADVKQNLIKINHHGKRAGAIVKGMLQHSQSNKGQKEPTDINALCDEYLRLSYHGLRAKEKDFNAKMETDFDEIIKKINIVPQDIGRVMLNLFNNAFYAVNEKLRMGLPGSNYEPKVSIITKRIGEKIDIKVTDNGNGIPEKNIDKVFQPFFTTKPTGQGTGLGLSLTYDIVKAHGGDIVVKSNEGSPSPDNASLEQGTTFILTLPII